MCPEGFSKEYDGVNCAGDEDWQCDCTDGVCERCRKAAPNLNLTPTPAPALPLTPTLPPSPTLTPTLTPTVTRCCKEGTGADGYASCEHAEMVGGGDEDDFVKDELCSNSMSRTYTGTRCVGEDACDCTDGVCKLCCKEKLDKVSLPLTPNPNPNP